MRFKTILALFAVVILAFTIILKADALMRGFGPEKYPSNLTFGIGAYFAPKDIVIYSQPDLNSPIKEELNWSYGRVQLNSSTGTIEYPEDVFISFYPYKEVAVIAVTDEVKDWVEVVYDQKNKQSGWVKLNSTDEENKNDNYVGKFFTWYEFMKNVAQMRGIYFIPGVEKKFRKLRGQPKDDAPFIKHEFEYVKTLQIKHIRGNWMLVKAIDLKGSPFGWVRWRDDNGHLLIFCSLDQ